MSNGLQVFSYEGNDIRTVRQDGEMWWVAKDVCDVFGETNRNRAMQALAKDEKGYTQMTTPGGLQNIAIINESGLYTLLFAMQPQKARGVNDEYISERIQQLRAFRRWVKKLKEWGAPVSEWECLYMYDVAEDEEAKRGDLYTCELCDCSQVRYVHVMRHRDYFENIGVGCVCAGIMEGNILAAKERDRDVKTAPSARATI